jgi:uncharacterized protein (TIGR02646 family)
MRPFTRGAAPDVLNDVSANVAAYTVRRKTTPKTQFEWPQRDGESILPRLREALATLTDRRCSYCDGYPIGDHGEEQVDHFRPKSRFPEYVLEWSNLYFSCTGCNGLNAKADQWDERLLRPDEPGFTFERYFDFNFVNGELRPNPSATPDDRERAVETIRILKLCRPQLCIGRLKEVRNVLPDDPDRAYRFL